MGKSVEVNQANFDAVVKNSEGLVIVDFWAPWCGPCKMIGPVLEEIATEYEGTVKVAKINVDENQSLAGQFGISSIPSLLFFKNGDILSSVVGAVPKAKLVEAIESLS